MLLHEEHILRNVADVTEGVFTAALVGSFRREAPDSGDIDVLIGYPEELAEKEAEQKYKEIIRRLQETGYITDTLAKGPKKCMFIVKLASSGELSKARRLDLLLTPPKEFPYALLYFTGSDKFNIQVRKKATEKGYSLSEHGLNSTYQNSKKEGLYQFFSSQNEIPKTEIKDKEAPLPLQMKTEKDILEFLDIPTEFISPKNR